MLRNVVDSGAFDPCRSVVPADRSAGGVVVRVEPVAGFGCQVDAADEGDAVVDDDRLFVMAVHRPLLRIEGALDLVSDRSDALAHRADLAA